MASTSINAIFLFTTMQDTVASIFCGASPWTAFLSQSLHSGATCSCPAAMDELGYLKGGLEMKKNRVQEKNEAKTNVSDQGSKVY